jgi:phage baseplate assembly protein gpV
LRRRGRRRLTRRLGWWSVASLVEIQIEKTRRSHDGADLLERKIAQRAFQHDGLRGIDRLGGLSRCAGLHRFRDLNGCSGFSRWRDVKRRKGFDLCGFNGFRDFNRVDGFNHLAGLNGVEGFNRLAGFNRVEGFLNERRRNAPAANVQPVRAVDVDDVGPADARARDVEKRNLRLIRLRRRPFHGGSGQTAALHGLNRLQSSCEGSAAKPRTVFQKPAQPMAGSLDLVSHVEGETMPESGVARAIVVANVDPRATGRISVRFPGRDEPDAAHWARLVAPMAGPNRGFYFRPEVGDEVLVAFEDGDRRRPYVVGGLWSGEHPPPASTDAGALSVLRTRSGHTLSFDDGPGGLVTLSLRDGKRVSIDDDGITVQDPAGNGMTIRTGAGGVSIHANGTLELKAGRISLDASGTVDVKAAGRLTLRGALVEIN